MYFNNAKFESRDTIYYLALPSCPIGSKKYRDLDSYVSNKTKNMNVKQICSIIKYFPDKANTNSNLS